MKKLLSSQLIAAFALAFIAASFMSGCSSSSSTAPAAFSYTNPKPGTAYRYHVTTSDSTGGSAAIKTSGDSTSIVVGSSLAYQGKTDVIAVLNDSGQASSDTTFYRFESNGDVSVYVPSFGISVGTNHFVIFSPKPWLTLPFGSQKTKDTLFTADTAIDFGLGSKTAIHIVAVADYVSKEELAPSGPRLAYGDVAKVSIYGITSLFTAIATQSYSVDPSLGGYFHSIAMVAVPPIVIYKSHNSTKERILYSYTLLK
jgi:hypothetical protein